MFIAKKVRFKNFKSYGNQFTEIDLVRNTSTVISAANGMGKSSILHAIEYGLFGKVQNINKPTLINEINNKDCLVEIECEKAGQSIMIRRGMKPNIFDIYIDGVMVDQNASSRDYQQWLEDTVLGFNLNSFKQVVSISGRAYTPFFMLSSGARRKMVDDLLDITVFSKMNAIHTGELNALKDKIRTIESDIQKHEAAIDSLNKGIQELSARDADIRQIIIEQISDFENDIQKYESDIKVIEQKKSEITFSAIDLKKTQTKLKKMLDISRDLDNSIKSGNKFIDFMNQNSECPTCQSELTAEFRNSHICKKRDKNQEIEDKKTELHKMIKESEDEISKMVINQNALTTYQKEIDRLNALISQTQTNIKFEKKKLEKTEENNESNLKAELISKIALLEEAKQSRLDALQEKQYADLKSVILKDSGIKSRIVNQMIPTMVSSINHYLTLLELDAKFEIDENFNETIYRRFKEPVTYSTFSAGECARIDIAVLFTWREIAKAKNSLSCNLLFLDEIFDNVLDEEGLELFTNLLKDNMPNTNVFLISHKQEVIDKFHSNIKIAKRKNFSYIV